MLTSTAIIAGMCVGSICLAALAARAAEDTAPTRRNLVTTQGMDANRAGASQPVAAGSDFLVKADGIKGETSDAAPGGQGAAKKRRTLNDIPVVKKIDQASPLLASSEPPPPPSPSAPPSPQPPRLSSNGDNTQPATYTAFVKIHVDRHPSNDQVNPPPPGQQRFQDVPPSSPYQPSGAAFDPGFQGGVRVAVGDVNAPAAALLGDDTGSSASAGHRTHEPITFKTRADSVSPGTNRPNLGSLQSVGSVGTLFLNRSGGDQVAAPGADGKLRLGTNAATSGTGGQPGGCAAACTNNLNTGKPGAVPMERFSMNYAKVGPGVNAAPGGPAAGGESLRGAGGAANPTPNAIRIISNGPTRSPANTTLPSTVQSFEAGGAAAATRKVVGVRK